MSIWDRTARCGLLFALRSLPLLLGHQRNIYLLYKFAYASFYVFRRFRDGEDMASLLATYAKSINRTIETFTNEFVN